MGERESQKASRFSAVAKRSILYYINKSSVLNFYLKESLPLADEWIKR